MDPCSHANILQVRTEHLHLEASAHFERNVLEGSVSLRMRVLESDVKEIVLDTRDITVATVSLRAYVGGAESEGEGCALAYSLGEANAALGTALRISLDAERLRAFNKGKAVEQQVKVVEGALLELRIAFSTSSESIGLQWLAPEQTEGKEHPYLFTQFQAIHCRTAVPCQDSPAVKTPYSATIRVPAPLVALMSATSTGSELSAAEGGWNTFHFDQPIPIPTYLIAMAVGKLESKDIGPRSRVWAEKETVEKAAHEFSDTELYLKTAEDLLCPYEWGRYDVLCMPKSFPYGGMENPQLTFVTPTLLAGDRSLSTVVAHEIAHSWCGNLVTNRHWENFWLNEGFTVFVERKIIGRLQGEPARQFDFIIGNKALIDDVKLFGPEHNYTTMIPTLEGVDPDEAFSSVPYERGAQFLFFLESLVGDNAKFEHFIRDWIVEHRRQSVDTDQFHAFFDARFPEVKDQVNWEEWLYKPGMPPVEMLSKFDDSLAVEPRQLAQAWSKGPNVDGHSSADLSSWNTWQTVAFLEQIVLDNPEGLPAEKLKAMDETYHFSASKNSEIRMLWLSLGLQSKNEDIFDGVVQFLSEQGRMKFVRPLFRDLAKCSENGRKLALETFVELKSGYHNIAQRQVAKDLGLSK